MVQLFLSKITLSIVIVSYNTQKYTLDCLSSVFISMHFGMLDKSTEVIVIDNASNDQTVTSIRRKYPTVTIIRNTTNKGFAAANNQGIRKAKGEFILLLNSDTKLREDTLTGTLERIKKDSKIGVLGCKIINPNGSLQPSFGYLPRLSRIAMWMFLLDDVPLFSSIIRPYHANDSRLFADERQVGWVTGAFFLLRRSVLKEVGYLDENIFMYGEEVDLCYRIVKSGYIVLYTPVATIIHHKGASSLKSEAGIVEEFKTMIYLFSKHKPSWELPLLRIVLSCGALLRIILFGIIGRYEKRIPYYKKALRVVWR